MPFEPCLPLTRKAAKQAKNKPQTGLASAEKRRTWREKEPQKAYSKPGRAQKNTVSVNARGIASGKVGACQRINGLKRFS
jgi:hypothetical protein